MAIVKTAHSTQTHIGWDDEVAAKAGLADAERSAEDQGWKIRYGTTFYDRINKIWGHTIVVETGHRD